MSPLKFNVLGPLEVREGDRSVTPAGQTPRMLLGALLLNANRVVSADELIEILWREPPPSAQNALQVHVSRLRKHLADNDGGGEVLLTRRPGYMVLVDPEMLDSTLFSGLAHEGSKALADGAPAIAAPKLRDALALWRGPLLADLMYEPFVESEAESWAEMRLTVLEDRVEADLQLGKHAELVGELRSLCSEHPYRERLRAQLMLALYRSGRQADALHEYQETRRALLEHLGVEPSASLRSLQSLILAQDPSIEVAVRQRSGALTIDPATGMLPLIGRSAEIAALDDALRLASRGKQVLVTIEAAAGLGKTRLLEEWIGGIEDASLDIRRVSAFKGRGSLPGDCAIRLRLAENPIEEHPGTTVILLDDAQWADSSSLELLARAIGKGSTMTIMAHRPVSGPKRLEFDRVRARMHSIDQIQMRLERLVASDLADLIEAADPGRVAETLIGATKGVPFQLQRAVSRLVESGAIMIADGKINLTREMTPGELVISDPLAEVTETERLLIQTVSIAGAPVPLDVAANAVGIGIDEADQLLATNKIRHYLTMTAEGLLPVHDLAAAELLEATDSEERQRVCRMLAAEVMRDGSQPDRQGLAGIYLLEAGLYEEALPLLSTAALSLIEKTDYIGAMPLLDASLAALSKCPPNADLERRIRSARALAYNYRGLMDVALDELQSIQAPEEGQILESLRMKSYLATDRTEAALGEVYIAAAQAQALRMDDPVNLALSLAQHASSLAGLGFVEEPDAMSAKALKLLSLHGDPIQRYEGLYWTSHVPMWRDDARSAELALRRCVEESRPLGDAVTYDMLRWWALTLFFIGHVDEGITHSDEATEIADRVEATLVYLCHSTKGTGMSHCGFFAEALSLADEELTGILTCVPRYEFLPRYNRAVALLGLGRLEEASDEIENATVLCPSGTNGWYQRVRCRAVRFRIDAAMGERWRQDEAAALTDELLSTRRLMVASSLLATRAVQEDDRALALHAAQIGLDIGSPMTAARAAQAGDLWGSPMGQMIAARVKLMSAHVPATMFETWAAQPEVASALD